MTKLRKLEHSKRSKRRKKRKARQRAASTSSPEVLISRCRSGVVDSLLDQEPGTVEVMLSKPVKTWFRLFSRTA